MTQTLELSLATTRRCVQADMDDVQSWNTAVQPDVAKFGNLLGEAVSRTIARYTMLDEIDRLFREEAENGRPNVKAAAEAETISRCFGDYVTLADLQFRSLATLPPDHRPRLQELNELKRLRDAAAEMESVYRGEAQYFSGAPFAAWEDVRKQLGV